MAAIGPKPLRFGLLLAGLVICARADQAHDVLDVVNRVSTALTANSAAEAIAPFDKSTPSYDRLAADFSNLTSAYSITNEADVVDEQDQDNESTLVFDWTLTLQNENGVTSARRQERVTVRLIRKGKRWQIVELTPLSLFDPP